MMFLMLLLVVLILLTSFSNLVYFKVPGGLKGAEICSNDVNVGEILSKHYTEKKLVAAICAG